MAHALVVDDSRTIRKMLTQTLVELGFETLEAANGKDALAVLAAYTDPIELILTDWNMPEMNGLELLQEVRSKPEYKEVRIVMVTTETEMELMATALEAGANEYVMKPFTRDILVDKIRLTGIHV